ncbi:sensor histidine kinase [Herbiconiux liukaitaii]|uniref:sensor histidine kinase n=1 Tax=Herbiconiux liukaitaii TaxID=3342799 RepID=UPI0035B70664
MVLCLGVAASAFTGVVWGPITSQADYESPLWVVGAVVIVFGLPIATAVAALIGSEKAVRIGLVSATAGFPVVMLTLEPSLLSGSLPAEVGAPWILGITPLAAATAALVLPGAAAWAYSAALAVLVAGDRMLAFPGSVVDVALQDALVALLLQSVFVGLTLATLRAARSLVAAAAALRTESVESAQELARAREQSRADALIHDTVLATLLLAARATGGDRTRVAAQAQRGLAQIDRLRSQVPGATSPALTPIDLVWRVQSVTTELDPYAEFTSSVAGELTVPAAVADTIVDAVAEALRNSVTHAGGSASRMVVVDVREKALHIGVLDDGVGFDPDTLSNDRLGIRLSVRQRMAAVPGGSARISSRPGAGASVVLEWSADAPG